MNKKVVKGTDVARSLDPTAPHPDLIDALKEQLLIVFLKRLQAKGDDLTFSVKEVDDTYQDIVAFQVVDGKFRFELRKKE